MLNPLGNLTACILIGPDTDGHMVLPTHTLFLTEGPLAWTLVPTGLQGPGPHLVEKRVWIPTAFDLLEDGLLLLGLHLAAFPELAQRADLHFRADWRDEVDLRRDIALEDLRALHALNRQQDWPQHLTLTVLFGSALLEQLGLLRQYRFGLDLCTWQQCRYLLPGGVLLMHCDPIPADLIGEEDDLP